MQQNDGKQNDIVGNFQSSVFQIIAEEKYKRIKKLEKLIVRKQSTDSSMRLAEQEKRVRAGVHVHMRTALRACKQFFGSMSSYRRVRVHACACVCVCTLCVSQQHVHVYGRVCACVHVTCLRACMVVCHRTNGHAVSERVWQCPHRGTPSLSL